ncbi:MAG: hypothetical protein RLZZ387_4274 [Chloroflexota bacterium]|jgi:hypothetical protein
MTNTPPADSLLQTTPSRRNRWLLTALVVALLIAVGSQLGVYTIQPIGAVPEGRTVIIWRGAGEPLFNSADAECLRIQQGVSLLCRGLALGRAPVDRILLRLPYSEWAYLVSTGGQSFDR